jgi:hypothetical protein
MSFSVLLWGGLFLRGNAIQKALRYLTSLALIDATRSFGTLPDPEATAELPIRVLTCC